MVNQIDFAGGTEHTGTPSVTSPGHEQEFDALASAAVSPLIGRNAEPDCIAYLTVVGREDGNLMDELLNHVQQLRGSPYLNDDFSIIEARFHR
jgi:hypothetical protein